MSQNPNDRAVPAGADGGVRQELDDITLERAKRGDELACRALFGCYQRRVFSYLWRMLGRHATIENVEDLTQETFLRVFRALSTFRKEGPARLSTWIFTIGHRLALNDLRKANIRNASAEKRYEPALAPVGTEERAERAELGRRIQQALDKCTDEQRAVFLLREYHGLSTEEVSHVMEIPPGTIKSRLSRARAALREALESDHE